MPVNAPSSLPVPPLRRPIGGCLGAEGGSAVLPSPARLVRSAAPVGRSRLPRLLRLDVPSPKFGARLAKVCRPRA